jgi:hypothetical protein
VLHEIPMQFTSFMQRNNVQVQYTQQQGY